MNGPAEKTLSKKKEEPENDSLGEEKIEGRQGGTMEGKARRRKKRRIGKWIRRKATFLSLVQETASGLFSRRRLTRPKGQSGGKKRQSG